MTVHTWSPQQARALDAVAAWYRDPNAPPIFRLFGYAGTGKTTLAMHLAEGANAPIFGAFTGKAASVLRDKGCPGATTLHSLIYRVSDGDKTRLKNLQKQLEGLEPGTTDWLVIEAEIQEERVKASGPSFTLNPESHLHRADLLVVDEVSMVDSRLGADVMSFKKKVLVLGDPAQLPPVAGGGYFTNAEPDVLLTEIHRQATDNPILWAATLARRGEIIPPGEYGKVRKIQRDSLTDAWLAKEGGQILTGRNETRRSLNTRVRAALGFTSELPEHGDVLVMLMNDHKLGVLNGTLCKSIGNAQRDETREDICWMRIYYEKQTLSDLRVATAPFLGRDPEPGRRANLLVDFGYALTVHKAQGSQWPVVTIFDDGFGKREAEVRRRWLYTAITRASESLVIAGA